MGSDINVTLGNWSEWFMLLAAMTYMVAFVAFVWDMATHSKTLAVKERSRAAKQAAHHRANRTGVGNGVFNMQAEIGAKNAEDREGDVAEQLVRQANRDLH